MERHTGTHKIPYFVKKTFEQDFSGNIIHLESQVEEEYISNLRFRCYREKDYKENLLFRARYYGDDASYDRAMQLHMPNCDRLSEILAT
ncbi:unnamed protein product [Schistosoma margrebowiei]|nr:unnamed protein product [Schistosoma margrebowiei]